jgi:hypothetical protein
VAPDLAISTPNPTARNSNHVKQIENAQVTTRQIPIEMNFLPFGSNGSSDGSI